MNKLLIQQIEYRRTALESQLISNLLPRYAWPLQVLYARRNEVMSLLCPIVTPKLTFCQAWVAVCDIFCHAKGVVASLLARFCVWYTICSIPQQTTKQNLITYKTLEL